MVTALRSSSIRLVIVDAQRLVADLLREQLERLPGISVVALATEGAAVPGLVALHQPDLLVLDLDLPDQDGVAVVRQIRSASPAVAVLALTHSASISEREVLRLLGVRGYLSKTAPVAEFVAAVGLIATGHHTLWASPAPSGAPPLATALTPREHEVLRLLASGLGNARIAEMLGLRVKSVEFHVTHILDKLEARSRSEAIGKAQAHGLIRLGAR